LFGNVQDVLHQVGHLAGRVSLACVDWKCPE
jgi:hypothetical protein